MTKIFKKKDVEKSTEHSVQGRGLATTRDIIKAQTVEITIKDELLYIHADDKAAVLTSMSTLDAATLKLLFDVGARVKKLEEKKSLIQKLLGK